MFQGYDVENLSDIANCYVGSASYKEEIYPSLIAKSRKYLLLDNFEKQGMNDKKIKKLNELRQTIQRHTKSCIVSKTFKEDNKMHRFRDRIVFVKERHDGKVEDPLSIMKSSPLDTKIYTQKTKKCYHPHFYSPVIDICQDDFIERAIEEVNKSRGSKTPNALPKISVIIAVHPCQPGGSFMTNGKEYSDGLEEEAYRRTSLSNSIQDPDKHTTNIRAFAYQIPEFGAVFVPQVLLLRQSESRGYRFYKKFVDVNFLLCSAIKKPKIIKLDKKRYRDYDKYFDPVQLNTHFREKLIEKMRTVLNVARKEQEDVLIFGGPFGCFKSPPFDIGFILKGLFEAEFKNVFKKIIFCVKENKLSKYRKFSTYFPFHYAFKGCKTKGDIRFVSTVRDNQGKEDEKKKEEDRKKALDAILKYEKKPKKVYSKEFIQQAMDLNREWETEDVSIPSGSTVGKLYLNKKGRVEYKYKVDDQFSVYSQSRLNAVPSSKTKSHQELIGDLKYCNEVIEALKKEARTLYSHEMYFEDTKREINNSLKILTEKYGRVEFN